MIKFRPPKAAVQGINPHLYTLLRTQQARESAPRLKPGSLRQSQYAAVDSKMSAKGFGLIVKKVV